jgi:hypothetical protein
VESLSSPTPKRLASKVPQVSYPRQTRADGKASISSGAGGYDCSPKKKKEKENCAAIGDLEGEVGSARARGFVVRDVKLWIIVTEKMMETYIPKANM